MVDNLNKYEIFKNTLITEKSEPFRDDYLHGENGLEPFAVNLSGIMKCESQSRSFVVLLDAPYGCGKTTFIDMLGHKLLNEGCLAIKHDAWKCDYSRDAFSTFMWDFYGQLEILIPEKKELFESLGECIAEVLKFGASAIGNMAALLEGIARTNSPGDVKSYFNEDFKRFKCERDAIENFKSVIGSLTNKCGTLYFFVDELDRCRPHYAMRLLESIKHLFDAKNVCFIVGADISVLEACCKKRYGDEFCARFYLERFFDLNIKLPKINYHAYLHYAMERHSGQAEFVGVLWSELDLASERTASIRKVQKYIRLVQYFYDIKKTMPSFFERAILCLMFLYREKVASYKGIIDCGKYKLGTKIRDALRSLKDTLLPKDFEQLHWAIRFLISSRDKEEFSHEIFQLQSDISSYNRRDHLNSEQVEEREMLVKIEQAIFAICDGRVSGRFSSQDEGKTFYKVNNNKFPAVRKYDDYHAILRSIVEFLGQIEQAE